jgi:hypothetical protein
MNTIKKLQIAGGVIAIAWAGSLYHRSRTRKRDRFTKTLLGALTQRLHPITKGLPTEAAFDVHYAQKVLQHLPGRIAVLKKSVAKRMATQLHSGFRPWYLGGDNEEIIYSVLRNLNDKVQVSQIANAYQDTYKINLIEQLQNHFDTQEIKKVLSIVRRLPKYRTV